MKNVAAFVILFSVSVGAALLMWSVNDLTSAILCALSAVAAVCLLSVSGESV